MIGGTDTSTSSNADNGDFTLLGIVASISIKADTASVLDFTAVISTSTSTSAETGSVMCCGAVNVIDKYGISTLTRNSTHSVTLPPGAELS